MNYFRTPLILSLAALVMSGCDRTDGERPEPAPPKPVRAETPKSAAPAVQSKPAPDAPAAQKSNEAQDVEALRREIEELRKKLKNTNQTLDNRYGPNAVFVPLAKLLERTRKQLVAMNSGYVALKQLSTDELVKQRNALGKTTFVDSSNGDRHIEIREILIRRLDTRMTREEVHRILGDPELAVGSMDYYSQNCLPHWHTKPLDLGLALKPVPVQPTDWEFQYYRVRYCGGYFSDFTSPKYSYYYWGSARY